MEQELSRAIIDATVDECAFGEQHTRLVKYLCPRRLGCRARMLQPVAVGHKSLADYTHLAGRPLIAEIRELAEDLQGLQGPAPLRHGLRRRRRGDPLHADPAHERRGHRGRVAGHARARGVLQRHQAPPQRAPGQPRLAERRGVEDLRALQRAQRHRDHRRLGRDHRPRPAAGRHPAPRAGQGRALGLALPHRPVHARTRTPIEHLVPLVRDYDSSRVPPPGLRARRAWTARATACASARRRSTRSRPRTWRSRPRTPPSSATSSASTWTGRCMCQVSRFDPWKDPIGRDRRVPAW